MHQESNRKWSKFKWTKSNRERIKKFKNSKNYCHPTQTKKIIKKVFETKKGLREKTILRLGKCVPSFLGCFAENELSSLKLQTFPCFLISNIDTRNMKGSHWIGLGIFKDRVEIFDSLGFNVFNWSRVPCSLLNFLHRITLSRSVFLSPCIQNSKSVLCGFYSLLYIQARQSLSFNEIVNLFSKDLAANDEILMSLFA